MEIKALQEEMQLAVKAVREYAEREIAEVKKNGIPAPETIEALKKANDRIDELETKLNRSVSPRQEEKAINEDAAALNTYLRKGWTGLSADMQTKAMSVGSDPDGGYLVTPAMGSMVTRIYDTTPMFQICDVETISTDALEGLVDNDEATIGWVGETGTRSVTATPTFDKYRISTHEAYAAPRITQKLLDDASFNVDQWLANKVSDKISRTFNTAFITGNGTSKPYGFTSRSTAATADSSRSWGTLQHTVSGASADFNSTDPADAIIDLVYSLKAGYRQGAVFLTNKAVLAKMRKFKDTTDQYLWQPSLQAGQPSVYMGYSVIESEDMPALAASSLSLAFGNFKRGYKIVNRMGVRVLRDPYTAKPYVEFYTTARVGGDVVDSEAIKLMKFSA